MIREVDFFKAEVYKTKWSGTVLLGFIIPLIVAGIAFLRLYNIRDQLAESGFNPWSMLCMYSIMMYSYLFPLYSMIIAYSAVNIESKNNGYRLLFTLPIKRGTVYTIKLGVMFSWLVSSLLLAYLFIFSSAAIFSLWLPQMKFSEYSMFNEINKYFLSLGTYSLLILLAHNLFNFITNNFIISTAIGFSLLIFGAIIADTTLSKYIPYAYPFKAMQSFSEGKSYISYDYNVISIVLIVFLFVIGKIVFERKAI